MSRDTRELCPATQHTPQTADIAPEEPHWARKHATDGRYRARRSTVATRRT
jgi:hypothetical protein